ncbi:family S53 protease [Auriscalpium vulgare]|uniref:Family S53 protease n=1 Tax=Auriscalpium vulgare TaxID=40419 RepID=A0ACB8RMJ3_9AGAM|nr:family S53 protease [Auriscalpium vulgare]
MTMKSTLILVSFLTLVYGTPHSRDLLVHERRDDVPHGFTHKGPAPADQTLTLRLALAHTDVGGLQDALYDVSTPGSSNYGQHLSKEDLAKYVAPTPESAAAVTSWLSENGLSATVLSPAGDWISIETTAAKANELFDAHFSKFVHASGKETVRTLSYSIPASLKSHLDLVHPTVTFPNIELSNMPLASVPLPLSAREPSSDTAPLSCNNYITPKCLQELYGIPSTPATQDGNQLYVTGLEQNYANRADLRAFLTQSRPDMSPNTTFAFQSLDGGQDSQNISEASGEADLDVQYTIGVATGVPVTFISVGNVQDGDANNLLDLTNKLLSQEKVPQVLTTSYGDNEHNISRPLAEKLCNAFAQLGARGTSVLFGSGDGGVSGIQPGNCGRFVPTFPATCPFITAVGGTRLVSPIEVAANLSSGGFSNYFGTPSYQVAAKQAYLANLGQTKLGKSLRGRYNASGRGYPDVSAIAESVLIVTQGESGLIRGTSCSSPIFASVVALLNDGLLAANKTPLGFLNPLLYSEAGMATLTDIKLGNNSGCGTEGFSAVAGWDPVTGLGSPIYSKMASALGL